MVETLDEVVEFRPRNIPGEELLSPFSGDNAAGEDLSLEGIYDKLKDATRADDPKLLGGDAYKPKEGWKIADWDKVAQIAVDCLTNQSKDFRVAAYLARSLGQNLKLTGMTEGLWLLVELQERFWDQMHPLPDKIRNPSGEGKIRDPLPRAQDLEQVLNHYASLLTDQKQFPPCDENEDEEAIGKVVRRVDNMLAQLDRLDALVDTRYFQWGPSLRTIREPLEKHCRSYRSVLETRGQARRKAEADEERKKAEAERRERQEAERREADAAARAKQLKELGLDIDAAPPHGWPQNRAEAVTRIGAMARWLRSVEPSASAGYRLTLVAAWGYDDGEVVVESPTSTAREGLQRLVREKSWDQLVDGAISVLAQPLGSRWLDPVSYIAMALEEMGDAGATALEEFKAEVRQHLSRNPGLVDAAFADGTPVASDETREWLAAIMAEGQPFDDDGAGAAGLPPESITQAEQMCSLGQVSEALELLKQVADSGGSERQRFLMRLGFAEFCLERGLSVVADPLLRNLMEMIQNRDLEQWENPKLLGRVYNTLYRLAQSGNGSDETQALAGQVFERLCLLDPGKAVKHK